MIDIEIYIQDDAGVRIISDIRYYPPEHLTPEKAVLYAGADNSN
jgi:hypothetical protein